MLRVALGGPMGSGKSTVGRALSARLGVPFVDLDAALGDIPALFAARGEDGFRDLETETLSGIAHSSGVLALGGGTLIREVNRRLLGEWTVVILTASRETLRRRLAATTGRPLGDRWEQLLDARALIWAAYGPPVSTDVLDVERVVDEVLIRC